MHILMTGGTGCIGQAFIQHFSDYQFTVLSRSNLINTDLITYIDSLDHLSDLNGFDAVINLAGEPIIDKRWSKQQKQVICQSRWKVTEQIVALFARSQTPPAVFLSSSAIGIYGDQGDIFLPESDSITAHDFPAKVCLQWEQLARQAEPFTRVVLLRTGIVLTTHGGALTKMLLPFKCGLGGRISHGQHYMSWIHYQDHIQAMHYLLSHDISGSVNIVAPQPVMNRSFSQLLAAALHRPAVLPMPAWVLKLVLGESSCLLLNSQRVIPQVLLNHGFDFSFPDLASAFRDLLKPNPSTSSWIKRISHRIRHYISRQN